MGIYAPFDNATLVFNVYNGFTTDENTGNRIQQDREQTYVCNIQLSPKFSENREGLNKVDTLCEGHLLNPAVFDTKIKAGMTATATINGVTGKFRLLDLGSNLLPFARSSQFQEFRGEFEQIGAAG